MRERICRLIEFMIVFVITLAMQDYIFKCEVKEVIKENPNITLQEFMGKEVEKDES